MYLSSTVGAFLVDAEAAAAASGEPPAFEAADFLPKKGILCGGYCRQMTTLSLSLQKMSFRCYCCSLFFYCNELLVKLSLHIPQKGIKGSSTDFSHDYYYSQKGFYYSLKSYRRFTSQIFEISIRTFYCCVNKLYQ